ncbi:MAG TPA: type II toxin-antitoxin system death-on-curing family toxin [Anaerolineae bacterium]
MRYLDLEQVLRIHERAVVQYGGSLGVRDQGLLESALAAPQQTMFGQDLYPDLASKAAILNFSLVKNHPFVDGNKRTGLLGLLLFLNLNGSTLNGSNDDLYDFPIDLATSRLDKEQAIEWIRRHIA